MTVVERDEWVPAWSAPMTLDATTSSRMSVFYAKMPASSLSTDGLIVRLMADDAPGERMYTVKILRNRRVTIGRSARGEDGVEETEDVQTAAESNTERWLTSDGYTGFWVLYNQG